MQSRLEDRRDRDCLRLGGHGRHRRRSTPGAARGAAAGSPGRGHSDAERWSLGRLARIHVRTGTGTGRGRRHRAGGEHAWLERHSREGWLQRRLTEDRLGRRRRSRTSVRRLPASRVVALSCA